MKMWLVSVLLGVGVTAGMDDKARLAVTHRDLVPECLDGSSVPAGTRSWTSRLARSRWCSRCAASRDRPPAAGLRPRDDQLQCRSGSPV